MESPVTIRGRRLELRDLPAPNEAPPVVLLHEGLGSAAQWRDVPARLRQHTRRRVIVYSRYGNGFSEPLQQPRGVAYMHDEADGVPELLDALDIDQGVLYGHSDGASIALIAASRFPRRVAAVIVEAPHLFVEPATLEAIADIGRRYRQDARLRERIARRHADGDATFWGWNRIWLDPAFAAWTIEDEAARIQAPVLALQGDADPYGALEQIRCLAGAVPGRCDRIVLGGCGHAPHRERPDFCVAAIAAWIAQLTGGS